METREIARGHRRDLWWSTSRGGMTSRAVVDRVVRLVGRVKVGHAGTLDPLASGVLVVCVGAATRLVEDDPAAAQVVPHRGPPGCAERHARRGRADRAPRPIRDGPVAGRGRGGRGPAGGRGRPGAARVLGPEGPGPARLRPGAGRAGGRAGPAPGPDRPDRACVRYDWPRLELEIDCGAGTYIRSIARDVGEALGCGGLVEVLVRTRIGPFTLEDAVDLAGLSAESIARQLRPAVEAVAGLPRLVLDPDQVAAVAAGRRLSCRRCPPISASSPGRGRAGRPRRPAGRPGRSRPGRRMDPAAQGLCASMSSGSGPAAAARGPDRRRREPRRSAAVSIESNILDPDGSSRQACGDSSLTLEYTDLRIRP